MCINFAQNIDSGNLLQPRHLGRSNEQPQFVLEKKK